MLIMLFNHSTGEADYRFTGVRRSEGEYIWNNDISNNLKNMDVWVAFRNTEETKMSDSVCLTI